MQALGQARAARGMAHVMARHGLEDVDCPMARHGPEWYDAVEESHEDMHVLSQIHLDYM